MPRDQPLVLYLLSAAADVARSGWGMLQRASYAPSASLVTALDRVSNGTCLRSGAAGGVVKYCYASFTRCLLIIAIPPAAASTTLLPAALVYSLDASNLAAGTTLLVLCCAYSQGMHAAHTAALQAASAARSQKRASNIMYSPPDAPQAHPMTVYTDALKGTLLDCYHVILACIVGVGMLRVAPCVRLCNAIATTDKGYWREDMTYQQAIRREALNTFCCYAGVPFALITGLCVVRAPGVARVWSNYDVVRNATRLPEWASDVPTPARRATMGGCLVHTAKEAALALAETLVLGFTVVGTTAIMPWRLPRLVHEYCTLKDAPHLGNADGTDLRRLRMCGFQLRCCVVAVPETVAAVVVLCTVYRAPALVQSMYVHGWHHAKVASARRAGRDGLCMVIWDATTAACMCLTVVPTLYRIPRCWRIISTSWTEAAPALTRRNDVAPEWTSPPDAPHRLLLHECRAFVTSDVPAWVQGGLLAVSLFRTRQALGVLGAWRVPLPTPGAGSVTLEEPDLLAWKARECSRLFTLLLLDVVHLPAALTLALTLYRLPAVYSLHAAPHGLAHADVAHHAVETFKDLPYIACALLACPTHRSPLYGLIAGAGVWRGFRTMSVEERRRSAWCTLQLLVLDIAGLLGVVLVGATLWRVSPMRARWRALPVATAGESESATTAYDTGIARRKIAVQEAVHVLIGVLTLQSVLPWLALWRLPTLLRAIDEQSVLYPKPRDSTAAASPRITYDSEVAIAKAVYCAPFVAICDIVCGPARFILWVSRWQYAAYKSDIDSLALAATAPSAASNSPRGPSAMPNYIALTKAFQQHAAAMKHLLYLVLDVPVVLCIPLALWRGGHVLAAARRAQSIGAYPTRLKEALEPVATAAVDVVCGVAYGVLSVSWRRGVVVRACGDFYSEPLSAGGHGKILRQVVEVLVDVPHIVLAVGSCWRVVEVVRGAQGADVSASPEAESAASSTHGTVGSAEASLRSLRRRRAADVADESPDEFPPPLSDEGRSARDGHSAHRRKIQEESHAAERRLVAFRAAARAQFALFCCDILSLVVIAPAVCVPWHTVPVALELISVAVQLVRGGSDSRSLARDAAPLFARVEHAQVRFPTKYVKDGNVCGVEICIGVADSTLPQNASTRLRSVKMAVDGNDFWRSLSRDFGSIVSAARATLFPLALSEHQTNAYEKLRTTRSGGVTEIVVALATGCNNTQAMSQATLKKSLGVVKDKDAYFTLRFECEVEEEGGVQRTWLCPPLTLNMAAMLSQRDFAPTSYSGATAAAVARVQNELPDSGCGLHALAQRTVLTQYAAILPEVAAFAASCAAPWRLPQTLRWLFSFEGRDLPTRVSTAYKTMKRCVKDDIALLCFTVMVLSVWRMPALYSTCRKQKVGTLKQFKAAVRWQFKEWCLDCLQLFELLFIVATLVQVVDTVRRLRALFAYRRTLVKLPRLNVLESLGLARGGAQQAEAAGTGDGARVDHLPYDCVHHIMQYLDAKDLVASSGVCYNMYCTAQDDDLWRARYESYPWAAPDASKNAMARSAKASFIERYESGPERQRRAKTARMSAVPQHVLDHEQGIRYLIRSEFRSAVDRIPHFFMLPFKVLGVPMLMVMKYMQWRFSTCDHVSELYRTLAQTMAAEATFWGMHNVFFYGLLAVPMVAAAEVSVPLYYLHVGMYNLLTCGAYRWHHYMPTLGDLAISTGGTLYALFSLYVVCTHLPESFHWWMPEQREGLSWLFSLLAAPAFWLPRAVWKIVALLAPCVWWAADTAAGLVVPFIPCGPGVYAWCVAAATKVWALAARRSLAGAFSYVLNALITPLAAGLTGGALESLRPTSPLFAPYLILHYPLELLITAEGVALNAMWQLTFGHMSVLAGSVTAVAWVLSWKRTLLRCVWVWACIIAGVRAYGRIMRYMPQRARVLLLYQMPFLLARFLLRGARDVLTVLAVHALAHALHVVTLLRYVYEHALRASVYVCKDLGIVGDLALIPITAVWCGLPLVVPSYRGQVSLYFTALCLTAYLITRARAVVKDAWA